MIGFLSFYLIAISLTLCSSVNLNDKCIESRNLLRCSEISSADTGSIPNTKIRIENSTISLDKEFLNKFPSAIALEFYRVNVTFALNSDDGEASSLRKLSIDSCELIEGISSGLSKLEVLNVKNTQNAKKLLSSCPNLYKLSISSSNVTEISLKSNQNLRWMDLSNNNLSRIPDFLSEELNYLDLSGNNIVNITKENFENLTSLEVLILEKNNITVIPNNTFEGLDNLNKLFLSNNSLSSTEFLINLTYVDLSYNQISKIIKGLSSKIRIVNERTPEKSKTASYISLSLVMVFCGLVLTFIFYCGK